MKTKILPIFFVLLLAACTFRGSDCLFQLPESSETPPLIPYNQDSLLLPVNIAPLNFCLPPDIDFTRARGVLRVARDTASGFSFRIRQKGSRIPLGKWRKLLRKSAGESLQLTVFLKQRGEWKRYRSLTWRISPEPIDPYLLFRISQYEEGVHGNLLTVERNLTNFRAKAVLDNRLMDNNCMNCHDCLQNRASDMVVHLREAHKGTLLMRNGQAQKITLPDNYNLRLTYPAWHPSGRYIAFSTNLPRSVHYADALTKIIYTFDTLGSVVVLDLERMELFSCPELTDSLYEDVFPTWSPDGTRLYFCRSPQKTYNALPCPEAADPTLSFSQNRVEQVWDDVMQIDFDTLSRSFSNLRLTYPFSQMRKSATMPKLSRNGRYLLVSLLKATTFPLQNLGDFYLLDMQTGEVREVAELNTPGSEKGHNFSSSGKWMVFSSSRRTLAIPETYICCFEEAGGTFSAPFLVPQKRGDFYSANLRGFVFPVLSATPSRLYAKDLAKIAKGSARTIAIDGSLSRFLLPVGETSLQGGH